FSDVMRQSRGEYFRWAGADDICRPDYLRCCAKVLDERPDVILCYPQTDIIDAHGAVTEHFDDRLHLDHASPARRYADLLKHFRKANAVFGLIRADVLRQTRLIDVFPSSDVVLLGELAVRGKFFEVPQRLFLRRIHPQHSMLAYDTARARSYWFAARPKGSVFPYWREYCEHLRSMAAAPLPLTQRIACLHYAFRRLHRHGRKVIWELLSGVPLAVAANLRPQRAVAVE
ncbi:MAG: hypothetical protein KDA41_19940, partial [Planctomycetales bacterium]|nr:hypothetical protein [Planctomycetales bacterium]